MRKPGLMVAIGLGKPKEMDDSESEPSSGSMEAAEPSDFDASAEEAFNALKDDDLEGFKLALKAAVMACQEDY